MFATKSFPEGQIFFYLIHLKGYNLYRNYLSKNLQINIIHNIKWQNKEYLPKLLSL